MNTSRFDSLWLRAGGTSDGAMVIIDILTDHYNESHRSYHTAEHIEYCLRTYDQVALELGANDAVEMALWFHDLVHMPGHVDNEARSAEQFRSLSNGQLTTHFMETVERLIRSTQHLTLSDNLDEQFVCDVDLNGLAKPWDTFIADTHLLREEDEAIDNTTFQAGLCHFINRLLDRPHIYGTSWFRARGETTARKNIKRLLTDMKFLWPDK
tara:strand:+ start:42 stop:674 length:633 start_codon:yes stop_codon:yes gene_type:complete